MVFSLIKKAKDLLISADVQSTEILKEIGSYVPDEITVQALSEYLNSVKMKDTEALYNRLFQDLMINSKKYFIGVSWKAAAVLCTKFAESVITEKHHHDVPEVVTTKNLNEKEVAGMEYLGGKNTIKIVG